MTGSGKKIGVAISGGGHRAALWGLGTLLYLVDSGLNEDVTVISSVSGGSITNGVVGKEVNFRSGETDPQTFRAAVQPLVTHITRDGLFFYGSATNVYLLCALVLAAAGAAAWLVVLGIMLTQVARFVLQTLNLCTCPPAEAVSLWVIGAAVSFVFALLALFAARYSKRWNPFVTGLSMVIALVGLGALVAWLMGANPQLPLEWGFPLLLSIALILTVGTLYWYGRRTRVAERALDRVHFHDASLEDLAHLGSADSTSHVICATELQSGLHAYFTDRFIYSYKFGVSRDTASISLARAVQSSAALPGAFGPQRIATKDLTLVDPESGSPSGQAGKPMVLLDGGVYDNMADQWFVGLADRKKRWGAKLDGDTTFGSLIEDVDHVIIANASSGWGWRQLGGTWARLSRLVREIAALGRAQAIMYNTIGRRRRAHLFDLWEARGIDQGTFVEVDQNPRERIPAEPQYDSLRWRLDELGLDGTDWESIVNISKTYPTVLRQIQPEVARTILWHAYINTAVAAAVYLGRPIPPNLTLQTPQDFATFDPKEGLRLVAPGQTVPVSVDAIRDIAPGQTVPVSVDAIRDVNGTRMARVTYFVVASDVPEPSWLIGLGSEFSLQVLGLMGVICGPGPPTRLFRRSDQIASLFEAIEANPRLSVEVEDLWIPYDWLARDREPERGDVYRLNLQLFQAAYRFRTEETSQEQFVDETQWEGFVFLSPEETAALRGWADARIEEARSLYPKDPELELAYREDDKK